MEQVRRSVHKPLALALSAFGASSLALVAASFALEALSHRCGIKSSDPAGAIRWILSWRRSLPLVLLIGSASALIGAILRGKSSEANVAVTATLTAVNCLGVAVLLVAAAIVAG